MSVVNSTGVQLASPTGDSASVNVDDVDLGTKIAPAVVVVDQTGAIIGFATQTTAAAILSALQAGLTVTLSGESTVLVGNFPSTQVVSGTVSVTGTVDVEGTVSITGGVSVSNFPTSFQISNFPATQPISAAALPLPSGAATATGVASVVTAVEAVNTTLGTPPQAMQLPAELGSNVSAASLPVVIASDQPPINVSLGESAPQPTLVSSDAKMLRALESLTLTLNSMVDGLGTGRMRVLLDALGGAQTLGTVTSVGTVTIVTGITNFAGVDIYQTMQMVNWQNAWANSVRARVQ